MQYQEGDIILCKVTNIVKTTVFVETLDGVKGSIVLSEVAPGRIRNIRAHVVPNKIIACKVLQIRDNHLFLSLRRVKNREKQELLDEYKKERSFESILKKISNQETIEKIKQENTSLLDFFEKAKENPKILDQYFNKEQTEQITKVIQEKKEKEKQIKKEFTLTCRESNGIQIIKKVLANNDKITYLGNSKFAIKIKSPELKKADAEIKSLLEQIEKNAKQSKCEFHVIK